MKGSDEEVVGGFGDMERGEVIEVGDVLEAMVETTFVDVD